MKLKKRKKEEISLIKRRALPKNKEVKIKKRKLELKETNVQIKRRKPESINNINKKKICKLHLNTKVIYTKTECPLCEVKRLNDSFCRTIDSQREMLKKGFDELFKKISLMEKKK